MIGNGAMMAQETTKLSLTPEGFSVSGQPVKWSDITEIVGYKIDRFTTDEIRLSFRGSEGEQLAEISEEWLGFDMVTAEMMARFPSTSLWHAVLSKPAFARNEATLYRLKS
jgi:hypothetical protein